MYAVGYFTEVGIGTPSNMHEWVIGNHRSVHPHSDVDYCLVIRNWLIFCTGRLRITNAQRSSVINVRLSVCGDRRLLCISLVGLVLPSIVDRMTMGKRPRIVLLCKVFRFRTSFCWKRLELRYPHFHDFGTSGSLHDSFYYYAASANTFTLSWTTRHF